MIARALKIKSSRTLATPKSDSKKALPIKRLLRWRWLSILLVGLSSNLVINIILDYKYQRSLVSFSLEEYFNAIVASAILLEGMRYITRRLDHKIPWSGGVRRRLVAQLGLHLMFIVTVLNVLLISVTYFFYGGFYSFGDLMVINFSVVSLVFFFSLIDTGMFFFTKWKKASSSSNNAKSLRKPIQLSLGRAQHVVNQENIRCAIGQSGLVVIVTREGRRLPYPQSLDTLMTKLDPDHFFRANRQTILSHQVVQSLRAMDYGKIQVNLASGEGHPKEVIISRPRAAGFRRWLKSQTA